MIARYRRFTRRRVKIELSRADIRRERRISAISRERSRVGLVMYDRGNSSS